MSTKPIASAVVGKDHIMVLADIIANRLNAIHSLVGKNRVYLIGSVDASALYWLAQQFDVLGYRGWFLADTEEKRRDLIRRAIELHRFKGTPWAVKEAIKSLGFTDVTIQERVGLNDGYYNGVFNYDESHTYGSSGVGEWATFKVYIGLDDWTEAITPEILTALLALINEYKNVRSHLVGLYFTVNAEDELTFDDVSDYGNLIEDADYLTGFSLTYDGTASNDGEYDYDHTGDSLQISEGGGEPSVPMMTISGDSSLTAVNQIGFAVFTALGGQSFEIDWNDGAGAIPYTSDGSGQLWVSYDPLIADTYTFNIIDEGGVIVGLDFVGSLYTGSMGGDSWQENVKSIDSYLPTLIAIFFDGHSSIQELNGALIPASLTTISATDTPTLTGDAVNAVLIKLDENGAENGTAHFANSGVPSGDAITAIINLLGKGWDVTFDT